MSYATASSPKAWWTVIVLSLAMMLSYFDRHLLVLFVTPMKASMGLSDTQVSLLIGTTFTLLYLFTGIPLARLVDRGSRRAILAGSALVRSAGALLIGIAPGFAVVALGRALQGIGSSLNAPASFSIIAGRFAPDRRARPIALLNCGAAVGSALALASGGMLLALLDRGSAVTLPVIGAVEPWQATFLIAALGGPVFALLIYVSVGEPARRPGGDALAEPGAGEVVRHLGRRWRAYLPITGATALNSLLLIGLLVWSPSLLERKFGWAVGTPGPYIGAIIICVAPIGLLAGGWLADRRATAGDLQANLRVIVLACGGLVPTTILYPSMPTATATLTLLALTVFFAMLGLGPANAAIQRITPDPVRGRVSAIYVAAVNITGPGLGPLLVALLTDRVFGTEARLPMSMALLAAILAPLALLLNLRAAEPYRRAVAAMRDDAPMPI